MTDPKRDPKAEAFEAKLVELMPKLKAQQVTLDDLEPGSLFLFGGQLGFKSEYRSESGAIEAYCLGSGEMFWGGTTTGEKQVALLVTPVSIKGSQRAASREDLNDG